MCVVNVCVCGRDESMTAVCECVCVCDVTRGSGCIVSCYTLPGGVIDYVRVSHRFLI